MQRDTHRKALAATARVACAAAVLTGCNGKQPVAKSQPVVDVPAPTPANTSEPASTTEPAPSTTGEAAAEPTAAQPAELAACREKVTKARGGEDMISPKEMNAELTACCQMLAKDSDETRVAWSGLDRTFCCSGLGWRGSRACTPWGPPVPPHMPAWLLA